MFSSFLETARNSPFKGPFSRAQCDTETIEPQQSSLVSGRSIAAAATAEGESCEFGSAKYFYLCGIGGILSCGTTHTFVVPLDLVKCRLQVDQAKYKNLFHGFKVSVAEEGVRGLAKGWAPTFMGYSAQVNFSFILFVLFSVYVITFLSSPDDLIRTKTINLITIWFCRKKYFDLNPLSDNAFFLSI